MGGSSNNQNLNPLVQELAQLQAQGQQPLGTTSIPILSQLTDVGNALLSGASAASQGLADYKNPQAAQKRMLLQDTAKQFLELPEAQALQGPQRKLFLKFAQAGDIDEMQQVLSGQKSAKKDQDRMKLIEAGKKALRELSDNMPPGIRAFAEANLETNPQVAVSLATQYAGKAKGETVSKLEKTSQAIGKIADEAKPSAGIVNDYDKVSGQLLANPAILRASPEDMVKVHGIPKKVADYLVVARDRLGAYVDQLTPEQLVQTMRNMLPQEALTASALVSGAKTRQAELKQEASQQSIFKQPRKQTVPAQVPARKEIKRQTKDGKIAIFDEATKKFLRYE